MQKALQETLEKSLEGHMDSIKEAVDAQVKETVDAQVKAAIEEAGLDKLEKGQFPGHGNGNNKDAKTAKELAVKYFKAVFQKDRNALKEMGSEFASFSNNSIKTMTEGTDSAGGYLVPEEVMGEVDRVADDYGIIRKLSRHIPMGTDTLNFTINKGKPSVYWPGEGGAGTKSQATLGNVKLQARTAMGLTPISNELIDDANIDTIDMVVELLAEEFAGAEDLQGLNGTGAPFTGILNSGEVNTSTAASGHDTIAEVDLKDLSDAQANLKSTVLGGAVWVFHRTVWNAIKNIQEGSQTVAAFTTVPSTVTMRTEGSQSVTPVGFLWGYPVYLSDQMPSSPSAGEAYGIFGNFRKFYFGDRKQMAVAVSSEATVDGVSMFETNSTAVRVIERVALSVGVGEAFNVLKLAAS